MSIVVTLILCIASFVVGVIAGWATFQPARTKRLTQRDVNDIDRISKRCAYMYLFRVAEELRRCRADIDRTVARDKENRIFNDLEKNFK